MGWLLQSDRRHPRPAFSALRLILGIGIVLGLAACSGSRPDAALEAPPDAALAELIDLDSLTKITADSPDGLLKMGSSFTTELDHPHAEADDHYCRFSPSWHTVEPLPGDYLAAAIYGFTVSTLPEAQTITLSWRDEPAATDVWIGLSDWASDFWELHSMEAGWTCFVDSLEPYINGDGEMYVLVIVGGTADRWLEWIRLGETQYYWVKELVDEGTTECCMYPSLALDEEDQPHFTYRYYISELLQDQLRYTQRDGAGGWNREVALTSIGGVVHTSLALDSLMQPHICHINIDTHTLYYTVWNGTDWDSVDIYTSPVGLSGSTLALDSNDRGHIAFFAAGDGSVLYAWDDGVQWNLATAAEEARGLSNLALDSSGRPWVAYTRQEDDFLVLANRNGTSWDTQVLTDYRAWFFIGLGIDGDDHSHLVFSTIGGADDFRYLTDAGGDWSDERICASPGVPSYCSLAVDEAGRPFAALVNDEIHGAYQVGGEWEVDELYQTSWDNVTVLDSKGRPHIASHCLLGTGQLRYYWLAEKVE